MEDHFVATLRIIEKLREKPILKIILGKSALIDTKCRLRLSPSQDVVLTGRNLDAYMDECLAPFLEDSGSSVWSNDAVRGLPSANSALINPFTSSAERDLSLGEIRDLIHSLKQIGYDRIEISAGDLNSEKDAQSISQMEREIESHGAGC
jgi:hypothetical protein